MRVVFYVWLFLVFAMTLTVPMDADAAIPQQITYQGYLAATDGSAVNKTVTLQLSLYDVATGGTPLWSEQQTVSVAGGQFSVKLGSNSPLNLGFDKPYFLGIKVDSDQEMSPRQQFTSLPYALHASTADAVSSGAVGTSAIADGAVTESKLGINCSAGQLLTRTSGGWGCSTPITPSGGTITGVIAGAGITGGGTTGSVTLGVDFSGNGSETKSARGDHNHDALYQKKYGKIAIVAKSGGDYATPSAALADAGVWCGTPSATNPCLVKIMPGVYDQGATSLVMVDFIDVEGSGVTNTSLTGAMDSVTSGVVNGANATLSKLTVSNSGVLNGQNAIAVFNSAAIFHLNETIARATGANATYAFYNSGTGSARIDSSYLDAPGHTIFNSAAATVSTFNTTFAAGTLVNSGSLACTASRDGKNVFFTATCPPFQSLSVIGSQPNVGTSTTVSNSLIKAQFNNDLNPTTVTTATFTVLDQTTGSYLNGTVGYDAATRTATFTPAVALSGTLVATVTSGVMDMSGGKLANAYSWSFTAAGGASDLLPPTVVSVTPLDQSTGILPATTISASFNKQIDRLTNTSGIMTLVDATGANITGKVQVSSSLVYFKPDTPLSLGTTYTATVSGARDLAGNSQTTPYSWSFATAPITAPSGVGVIASTTGATVTWQAVSAATGYNLYWSTSPFGTTGTAVTPTKITGVTSPYAFSPPSTLLFTGTLNLYISSLQTTSSPYGVSFTLTVPAGTTVTKVSNPATGQLVSFTQSANNVFVNNVGSLPISSSSPFFTVTCSGDFTGKTITDFTLSNVRFFDSINATISGVTLTTTSTSTAGTTYYFAVSAANAAGESPKSNTVSASIDSLPPVVTASFPTGSNINVSSSIGANFSEPMDIKSLTAATFAVTANGAPVTGTFTQSSTSTNSTIYFQPTTLLQWGTNYTATITGVKDLAGNALVTPYNWSFTTAAVGTPSGLTATRGNLQTTLAWTAAAAATSYNIYWSTTSGVTPLNGTKISGVTGTSYTHTGLTNGTNYYYVVTAVNGANEGLPSIQASVLIDNVAPTVTSTTPSGNATGVSISNSICVNFSKSISPSTWNNVNVAIKDASGAVVNGSFNSYTICSPGTPGFGFSPSPALGFNTTYTMTIGTGVQDIAGNGLAAPYSFSFTTTAVGTPSGLTATKGNLQSTLAWTAAPAATGYNIYWSTTYGVTPQNGAKISGVTGTSYTHTGLTNGTTYYYVVTAVNGTIEGLASSQATVLIDNVAPTVISTTPSGNATNVSISSPICVSFSKWMSTSYWNNVNVAFKDSSGVVVNGSYGYVPGYGDNCISPSPTLAFNTTYTMTVGTGVQDTAGNGLAAPFSFSFTTTAVGTPSGLTATRGNSQSTLAWTAAVAATSYNIYWSTTSGVTPLNGAKISGVTGTGYTHTGLTNGTTYYYVVTAVNGATEGLASSQATVLIDNVAPTVISTTPSGNATGVSISNSICVNFSKSINSSNWNNVNVTLKDATGAIINGAYTSPCFSPYPALGYNTTYTMTVGTGVQDIAGNGLAAPFSFSFTTTAVGTPSGLTATRGNSQSTLAWTAAAAATSYNIYWSTTSGVTPLNGAKISGLTGTSYTHTGLTNGFYYYYVVTAVNGTNEGLPSYQASVLIDNVPPTITATTPSGNATGVSISSSICVNFSKSISSSTWNNVNVAIKDASGAVVNGSYGLLCFYPSPALNNNTTYTMTISTGVQDTAGNALAAPYIFSFTTAIASPTIASPTGLTATAGMLQSDLIWTAVSGATSYNVYWSNNSGVTKTNSIKIATGSSTTSYSHINLANGSTYVYRVAAVTGGTESDLSNEVKVSFDTTAPVVISKSGGQAGRSDFALEFNEPIDVDAAVQSNAIQVTSGGAPVLGKTWYTGYLSSFGWAASAPFTYSTTYNVTVSGVKDMNGNIMAPYSWSFTTANLGVPSPVSATAGNSGSGQNTISWTGGYTYNVYWSTTSGVTTANGTKIVGAMSPFTHTGLTTGTTYYYVVTAVAGTKESAASAQVSALAP